MQFLIQGKPRKLFNALHPPFLNKSTILHNDRLLCIPSLGISATESQNNGRKHGWASFPPIRQMLFTAFQTDFRKYIQKLTVELLRFLLLLFFSFLIFLVEQIETFILKNGKLFFFYFFFFTFNKKQKTHHLPDKATKHTTQSHKIHIVDLIRIVTGRRGHTAAHPKRWRRVTRSGALFYASLGKPRAELLFGRAFIAPPATFNKQQQYVRRRARPLFSSRGDADTLLRVRVAVKAQLLPAGWERKEERHQTAEDCWRSDLPDH